MPPAWKQLFLPSSAGLEVGTGPQKGPMSITEDPRVRLTPAELQALLVTAKEPLAGRAGLVVFLRRGRAAKV